MDRDGKGVNPTKRQLERWRVYVFPLSIRCHTQILLWSSQYILTINIAGKKYQLDNYFMKLSQ
ncbi:hypothetical protein CKY10_03345 [Photorhabdus sp. HUG-39]|nr:hypothetical protein CKY10_03345 [Photorhabdus sp. HUG-39]